MKIFLLFRYFVAKIEIMFFFLNYKKVIINKANEKNNTKLVSNNKIILITVSDCEKDELKAFARYHLSIGINKIYVYNFRKYKSFSNKVIFIKPKKNEYQIFDQSRFTKNAYLFALKKEKNAKFLILDSDEFLFSNKAIDLTKYNNLSLSTYQINFAQYRYYSDNFNKGIFKRPANYKPRIFSILFKIKDLYKFINMLDKKVFFFHHNSLKKFKISKGNHKILSDIKTKNYFKLFILHAPLISKKKLLSKFLHEKRRLPLRNKNESLTSMLFKNRNKLNKIWNSNTWVSSSGSFKNDFSLYSCLN
jgi:hypothetical protein